MLHRDHRSGSDAHLRINPLDSRITMGFDCLFRGLEITTGSRRINEYRMLLINVESFGLERLTQKIRGLANVKEACLFFLDRHRVWPWSAC